MIPTPTRPRSGSEQFFVSIASLAWSDLILQEVLLEMNGGLLDSSIRDLITESGPSPVFRPFHSWTLIQIQILILILILIQDPVYPGPGLSWTRSILLDSPVSDQVGGATLVWSVMSQIQTHLNH